MADHVGFVEVNFALGVETTVVYWIIIALAQEQRLLLFLSCSRFAVVRISVPHLLYRADPVYYWNFLIFYLIHDYVANFDLRSLDENENVSSKHARFHRSGEYHDHG